MKQKTKRILCVFVCLFLLSGLLSLPASADMGPKASVRVTFLSMGEEPCYATLLSKEPTNGPLTAYSGERDTAHHTGNYAWAELSEEAFFALVDYRDADGYYFLDGSGWQVNESAELVWGYYPPTSFKILLYYPESDTFLVSEIYERYAFDSYYTVDLSAAEGGRLTAERSYEWRDEATSLVARILATIAVELFLALLFGLGGKASLLLIAAVNIVTQVGLNLALNLINYRSGWLMFSIRYIELELLVFLIEAILYSFLLRTVSEREPRTPLCVLYALVANAASFAVGFAIAKALPGIF